MSLMPSGRTAIRRTHLTCVVCAPAAGPEPARLYVVADLRGGSSVLECGRCGNESSVPTAGVKPEPMRPISDSPVPHGPSAPDPNAPRTIRVRYFAAKTERGESYWIADSPDFRGSRVTATTIAEARERLWEAIDAQKISRHNLLLQEVQDVA